jgi:UPF0755 protein
LSFLGNIIKGILALAMVAAVLVTGVYIATRAGTIFGNNEKKHDTVLFVVKPGENTTTIGQNLKTAGVLDKSGLIDPVDQFKLELKGRGVESKIQAGRFVLETNMDIARLVTALTSAPSAAGLSVRVIEGKRLEEIAEELGTQQIVSPTNFLNLAKTPEGAAKFQDDFLSASGRPGDQGLEGYLFPDTYEIEFKEGDNSEEVIKKMLDTMEEKFTPEMRQAAADQGRTIHQILTIASIVQREAVHEEEMPVIASVFWNRLPLDMRLDADPTTQYAAGKPGSWWKVIDFDPSTVDSPYNTYLVHGLPPGPICNPGEAAIKAALYPAADSKYLFFVAKGDKSGFHAFAETLEEHNRNRIEEGNIQP